MSGAKIEFTVSDFNKPEILYSATLANSPNIEKCLQEVSANRSITIGFGKHIVDAVEQKQLAVFFSLKRWHESNNEGPDWDRSRWFQVANLLIDLAAPECDVTIARGLFTRTFLISVSNQVVFRHSYRSTAFRDALFSDGADPWGSDFFQFIQWRHARANRAHDGSRQKMKSSPP